MVDVMHFILACFATFRLAELVTVDDGPVDVFRRARIEAGCYDMDEQGRVQTGIGRLLVCPWCVGVWVAGIASVFIPTQRKRDKFAWWLAIAGGQALLQSIGGRK